MESSLRPNHQWDLIIKAHIRFQTLFLDSGAIFYYVSRLAFNQRTQIETPVLAGVHHADMSLCGTLYAYQLQDISCWTSSERGQAKSKFPYGDKWNIAILRLFC